MGTGQGGDITIEARSLSLTNGAQLFTTTTGKVGTDGFANAGNIQVNASDSIFISGGSQLRSDTSGEGNAGNITILAGNGVNFDGVSPINLSFSGIISSVNPVAGFTDSRIAGQIKIDTGSLTIANGANIQSNVEAGAEGRSGNINITANSMSLTNGGQIQSILRSGDLATGISGGRGETGDVSINVRDTFTASGRDNNGFSSAVFTSVGVGAEGNGGDIDITARSLWLSNGGTLNASNFGQGEAGNLKLQAGSLTLDTEASLLTETASGEGGNITIQNQDVLLLRRNSNISTAASSSGNGGNINIDTTFIVAQPQEDSNIIADAIAGRGGNINIITEGIFGIQSRPEQTPESDITASSQLGIDGTIQQNSPDVDPSQGLVSLPVDTVDATSQIATGCTNSGNASNNKFTVTGRGGLPPNPGDTLGGEEVLTDWATLEESEVKNSQPMNNNSSKKNSSPEQVVEAQGWVFDAQGKVILTAQAPTATPNSNKVNATACQK